MKLQDYTAVERDDISLECELSKEVPVKWLKEGNEIKASKTISMKVIGKRCILTIKRVDNKDKGEYECDCGTDKTKASVNIEGIYFMNEYV